MVYDVIEACRCAFFLSHAIRTEVNFALDLLEENLFIVYWGERLRYLGPDERSQALLLRKAIDLGRILPVGQSKESTPGLRVWKGGCESTLSDLLGKNVGIIRTSAAKFTPKEILSLDSLVYGVGHTIPPSLSEFGNHPSLLERALPPPYDAASLGTKILYFHHMRDLV